MGSFGRWQRLQLPLTVGYTTFGLGFPATLTLIYNDSGLHTFWEAFTVTTPLTVAVLLITYLGIRNQLNAWGAIAIFVGAAVVSYYFGITATGHELSRAWTTTSCSAGLCTTYRLNFWPPQVIVGNLLGTYWRLYGAAGFIGAVATGVFLGREFNKPFFSATAQNDKTQSPSDKDGPNNR